MRRLAFAAALAIIAWAAFVVQLPVLVLAPHPAEPVTDIIELMPTGNDVSGEILFTAVRLEPATTAGAIQAAADPFRALTLPPALTGGGGGGGGEDFVQSQLDIFRESVQVSAATALRAAGHEVEVAGEGAQVMSVLAESPAEGVLQPGDLILEADGTPVELASQLAAMTSRLSPGDRLELTIERGRAQQQVVVRVRRLAQTGTVGIGIAVTTLGLEIQLPIEVAASEDAAVGGPSAGLMMGLAVYDLVDDGDLTRSRVVAGTGTLDLEGRVGMVDGIAEKVRGAEISGARIFLVPAQQVDEAREAAPDGMEVVPVATFEEALEALERTGSEQG